MAKGQSQEIPDYSSDELIAYGERSHFVTSLREPVNGRPSPDEFGLVFHVGTPLQDQVGAITPSALHYIGTTRGSFVPDIDPAEHGKIVQPDVSLVGDAKLVLEELIQHVNGLDTGPWLK